MLEEVPEEVISRHHAVSTHGQYYVAKSRVGEKAALKILVVGERRSDGAVITDNVVYPEVL